MDPEKKAYWKKRMNERTISFIKTLEPFEKEIRDMYYHSVSKDPVRLIGAFQKIWEGFALLRRVINQEPERTQEGVVDLSKI